MKIYKRDGTSYSDRQRADGDILCWAKDFEKDHRVAETTLPDGKWVSTVWLGIDHQFGVREGLIFETMVFPKKGDYGDLDCDRYSTEAEALEGHKRMCEKWSKPNGTHN